LSPSFVHLASIGFVIESRYDLPCLYLIAFIAGYLS
jgi:hypothetical protein